MIIDAFNGNDSLLFFEVVQDVLQFILVVHIEGNVTGKYPLIAFKTKRFNIYVEFMANPLSNPTYNTHPINSPELDMGKKRRF